LFALSGDPAFGGIAHAAHLGGLAFGFYHAWYHWRLAPRLDNMVGRYPGCACVVATVIACGLACLRVPKKMTAFVCMLPLLG
jgi:hypothetical protein